MHTDAFPRRECGRKSVEEEPAQSKGKTRCYEEEEEIADYTGSSSNSIAGRSVTVSKASS